MICSIANNRFLHRINPEIKRALADSGSSLEHSEIQQLMRQNVDLGIADNLKLWVHSGLIKARTSGSDLYVSKAYDISSESHDGSQAIASEQLKITSLGMRCNTFNSLAFGNPTIIRNLTTDFSVTYWEKLLASITANTSSLSKGYNFGHSSANAGWSLGYFNDGRFFFDTYSNPGRGSVVVASGETTSAHVNVWRFFAITKDGSIGRTYINAIQKGYGGALMTVSNTSFNLVLGKSSVFNLRANAEYNDIRIYNKPLSATEVSALYNQSKSKYGH